MKHNYPQSEILSVGTIAKLGQFLKTAFRGLMVIIFAQKASLFSTLCTKKHALLLATVVLCTLSFTARAQPGQQVINPANGDAWVWQRDPNNQTLIEWVITNPNINPAANPATNRAGLRIDINTQNYNPATGALTNNFRYGTFRVYDDYRENFSSMNTYIRFGNSVVPLTHGGDATLGDACTTTPVSHDLVTDIWTIVNVFKAISPNTNRTYNVYQRITYHGGDRHFFVDYEVAGDNQNSPEDIHIYVGEDTFPGGCDNARGRVLNAAGVNGPAIVVAGFRNNVVGGDCTTTRDGGNTVTCPISAKPGNTALVYKASIAGFSSYYSGANLSKSNGGTLVNSTLNNTNNPNCTDHGIAVHFAMGQLGARGSVSRRLMLGYGNEVADFTVDNPNAGQHNIIVENQRARLDGSTPVTVSFVKNKYDVLEGDVADMTNANSAVQGITIHVEGGNLNADVPIGLTVAAAGSTFPADRISLIPGFTIPAGDYRVGENPGPTNFVINSLHIKGNLLRACLNFIQQ